MQNTKLITLLITFPKKEFSRFIDFVNSPYFNTNLNLIKLLRELDKYYPAFDTEKLTEEKVYKNIFKNEKYDYFKMKNLISDLYELAIEFLKINAAENNDIQNEISLLNILHERKLDVIYSQREKKIKTSLYNAQIKDEDNYLLQYQLERINIAHYKFSGSSYSFEGIQSEFNSFLQYALTGLMRLYSKMLHNKNHGNIRFDMKMFPNIWEYVKDNDLKDNPSYNIYKQIIILENTKSEDEYRKLIELKNANRGNIPPEDHYYTLLVQNSYAAYMLKLGIESYYKERFNVFKEMVEYGYMTPEYIIYPNFISAFTSACMANEYEWAKDFLGNSPAGISPKEERLNTVNYCNGFLCFRKKEFGKALEYFSKTNFKLYLMKVMVKSYSARIYYELNMYDQTIAAIDSFRHYLKNEKLMAEDQKTAHYEFLKLITELYELRSGTGKADRNMYERLEYNINKMSSNPLGAKNWLLEKLNELNKKRSR